MNKIKTILLSFLCMTMCFSTTAQQTNHAENVKRRTEEALDNYYYCRFFSCNTDTSKYFYLPYGKQYYNENARRKLLSILRLDVDDRNVEVLASQVVRMEMQRSIKILTSLLRDTISHKSKLTTYRHTLDSLKKQDSLRQYSQQSIVKVVSQIKAIRPGNDLIIKAGLIDDERFISVFKKILEGDNQRDTLAVTLALARLRVAPYYESVIQQLNNSKSIVKVSNNKESYYTVRDYQLKAEAMLLYLCTSESIMAYASLLDCKFYAPPVDYDVVYYPIPVKVFEGIANVIRNKDFEAYVASIKHIPSGVTKDNITWVKKWLADNKDNFQLNRDYCPKGLF